MIGRPKLRWRYVIQDDTNKTGLEEGGARDRRKWSKNARWANSKQGYRPMKEDVNVTATTYHERDEFELKAVGPHRQHHKDHGDAGGHH